MISQTRRAARALTFAALSSSLALVYPLQAREHPASPPAAPATVSETSQAPASGARVVAIPVPLPLPGQLKPLPQAEPPAADRSRLTRSHPAPRDQVGAANDAARVQPDRTGFVNSRSIASTLWAMPWALLSSCWVCRICCWSGSSNRLFELGLGEVALAFAAASSKIDQLVISELTEAHGTAGFARAWLRHRGLAWAADMLPADPVSPARSDQAVGQPKE